MPDLLKVVDIQAPLATVHALVASAEGIAAWWSPETSADGEGRVVVRFGADWRVVLEKLEETESRVRWRIVEHDSDEWPGTELVFDLSEADGWTTLRFDHRGWAAATDFFRFCGTKWVVFLLSIKQAAETGRGAPYPDEIQIGRHG